MDIEKLKYLLNFIYPDMSLLVDHVLEDSKIDPHYSAVAITNFIKCYIQIMNEIGENMPFSDVEGFFEFNGYTKDEYMFFENSRQKEAEYYRGVQY